MAEGKILFRLNLDRFREALDSDNWFNLQHEFKTKGVFLSQILLIWQEESGNTWLLADFENQKTYDIEWIDDADENRTVEVSELSNEVEQPINLTDTEAILSRLQSVHQGTDQGFIDLLKRINLDELDLEGLKRSDLLGAGFSFESVYQDLLNVHSMLQAILKPSHEWVLNFPRGVARNVVNQHLQQFYKNVQAIRDFGISDENPREAYTNLVRNISNVCNSAKEPLRNLLIYLSSRKVEQLNDEVRLTVDAAAGRLETETNRAKENNNEVENLQKEIQQELSQLKLERQNQLAGQSVSEYKEIFEKQAKQYRKGAWIWLGAAGVATVVFFAAFGCLSVWLKSEGPGLTGALQNLFTKGFLLSPIYVWLNRSIKNHTAQKHLEVINTHRQKALETFDRFVEAAGENRETRDAVLLSATEAIFDANQTGYLSAKGSGSDSRSPVQQVIREIISDKSSPKS